MITAQLVKELRDATNLGILDCKKALEAMVISMLQSIG